MSADTTDTENLISLALEGLKKANAALQSAWDLHVEQLRRARAEVHSQAQQDLDAVDGRPAAPMPTEQDAPRSSDSDLP